MANSLHYQFTVKSGLVDTNKMFFKIITVAILAVAACSAQLHGGHHGGASYVSLNLQQGSSGGYGGYGGGLGGLGGGLGGQASIGASHGHGHYVDYHAHPKYEFKYGIADAHTKDHHQQHEIRDGDVVKGEYSLHEPDGTIRIVKYTADKHNGFNAQVIRQGHAAHPETTHKSNFVVPVQHHGGLGGGAGGLGGGLGGHGGYY